MPSTTSLLDKEVGSTGFGLMGMTWRANPVPYDQCFEAMKAALESGANFWNGGEFYGPPDANSLQLLAAYFEKYPADAPEVVLSIKGGLHPTEHRPDGSAAGVRHSVDNVLRLLAGKKSLDLFECARVDPKTPIEETIETLAEYIKAGKLGGISLSECSADSIRRAATVHKISAVEVELSMFSTEILENGVAKVCGELGIPIVAYSPLGRGFLTGLKRFEDLPEGDFRRMAPRFQPGAFEQNLKLAEAVERLAEKKGVTSGQVAIAWVKQQSKVEGMPTFIPIPGATTAERVKENGKEVKLSDGDMKELGAIIERCTVAGGRYPEALSKLNFGDSPKRS